MNIAPKTTISSCPLSALTNGRTSCSASRANVTSAAPTTAPPMWPAPPSIAMNRYSMPGPTSNAVGLMIRCVCAVSQPDRPASMPAMTNTASRTRNVLMPRLSAITAPPRSARMARPCRDDSRFAQSSIASPSAIQMR